MKYAVTLHPDAERELKTAFAWLEARSPVAAERWRRSLLQHAAKLARFPERCPLAPESERLGEPVRQLLYGRRAATRYRLLFVVHGKHVVVLHIRHGAQRPLGEAVSDD